MIRSDFCDPSGGGANKILLLIFGMSRVSHSIFTISRLSRSKNSGIIFAIKVDMERHCGYGNGATGAIKFIHLQVFQTEMETARLRRSFSRLPRPTWERRDSRSISMTGMVSATKNCNYKFLATEMETRRRDLPDLGGDGAITNQLIATVVGGARFSHFLWRRRDFPRQGGDGSTLQFEPETVRLCSSSQRRRDFSDQGGDGAETASFANVEVVA